MGDCVEDIVIAYFKWSAKIRDESAHLQRDFSTNNLVCNWLESKGSGGGTRKVIGGLQALVSQPPIGQTPQNTQ
tara:strand:+ start:285 stop:506 length:222 start_codon:yes stop_codon:yes gene_type:complete